MSLEKDIAMMVMLKKAKEMNMVNVVQNQDSLYQMLNTELEDLQQKLQHHIGIHYVPNYISSIPATDYVYAYLDRNQELVISSVDLHPDNFDLYDNDSNFEKCELQKDNFQKWYEYRNDIRTIRFEGMVKLTTCAYLFVGCENLTEIKNIKNLNTCECTNMSSMFQCCKSLTILDVSNFDTSNVTDMSYMFFKCTSLTNLDVSNFYTSKVTNMSCMFANCTSLTTLDVSNFDTSKVANMYAMFEYCESLTTLDLRNLDTSNVTDMSCMFNNCKLLTTLDVSNFDTGKVTDMYCVFYRCKLLTFITCPESVKDKILSEQTYVPSTITWTIV